MPTLSAGELSAISARIKSEIDEYSRTTKAEKHRNHLGASTIAEECLNFQWMVFRWIHKEPVSGRMARLFERGHREEANFINLLTGIGATVEEVDPETGKQWRISGVMGHFGGSLDAKVTLPESYGIPGKILGEFKTMGTGTAFAKLCAEGVAMQKPIHYGQMCVYGAESGLEYAAYLTTNKNDDDLHIEVVKLDWELGKRLRDKADRVINSQEPLGKIAKSATHKLCKYCRFTEHCHGDAKPEKSCRSCKHAFPIENAEWKCEKYGIIPGREAIDAACGDWNPIING